MVDAMSTTQNQNVQLIKTFIVAFAAMLFAIPLVAVITTSIVKAQFASIAHAQAQPNQSNSLVGPSCAVPADEQQANSASTGSTKPAWSRAFGPVSQNNSSTTNTTTTTNTTNNSVDSRFSGNSFSLTDNRFSGNNSTDNRFSGNSYTDNRFSGNTVNDNDTIGSNNNTALNSGNTTNTTTNNVNANVNSGNTIVNDNDGIDIL